MFHIFFCFDLRPGASLADFRQAFLRYTAHMQGLDLVESSSPIGERRSDTILDTDSERQHQYFAIMTFRDRAQADTATDYIQDHSEPGDSIHQAVYAEVVDPIFICWQDT